MRESIPCWQKKLSEGFSSATELLEYLSLPTVLADSQAEKQFMTRVPRGFAARMQAGNRYDPLLLQVLPVSDEMCVRDDFVLDPLSEAAAIRTRGLIHKYKGRVLLTTSSVCAINCRYCFRRHFPYRENNPGRHQWQDILEYIAQDSEIHEVILSGGDPLLTKDAVLGDLMTQLAAIPHVHTLRFHSRIPVVLPERIDDAFLELLSQNRLRKVMVLHSNHPNEIDNQVLAVCRSLAQIGCHVLNQSVLLAGVNDQAITLARLSERLFEGGVLPYYLHLLDKVQGAAHFDMPLDKAVAIFKELQTLLPGYLVPRLVREDAGKKNKTLISGL